MRAETEEKRKKRRKKVGLLACLPACLPACLHLAYRPTCLQSVAVAVHDVGEYVRHYPYGKRALEELGAKALVMGHMGVSNDRCCQRVQQLECVL